MKKIVTTPIYHAARNNDFSLAWSDLSMQFSFEQMKQVYAGCFHLNFYLYKTSRCMAYPLAVWHICAWNRFCAAAQEMHLLLRQNMLPKQEKVVCDYILQHILCKRELGVTEKQQEHFHKKNKI